MEYLYSTVWCLVQYEYATGNDYLSNRGLAVGEGSQL